MFGETILLNMAYFYQFYGKESETFNKGVFKK